MLEVGFKPNSISQNQLIRWDLHLTYILWNDLISGRYETSNKLWDKNFVFTNWKSHLMKKFYNFSSKTICVWNSIKQNKKIYENISKLNTGTHLIWLVTWSNEVVNKDERSSYIVFSLRNRAFMQVHSAFIFLTLEFGELNKDKRVCFNSMHVTFSKVKKRYENLILHSDWLWPVNNLICTINWYSWSITMKLINGSEVNIYTSWPFFYIKTNNIRYV